MARRARPAIVILTSQFLLLEEHGHECKWLEQWGPLLAEGSSLKTPAKYEDARVGNTGSQCAPTLPPGSASAAHAASSLQGPTRVRARTGST